MKAFGQKKVRWHFCRASHSFDNVLVAEVKIEKSRFYSATNSEYYPDYINREHAIR
jgi:hypothetical protein